MSHTVGKVVLYIVFALVVWLIACAAWPFWDRYKMQSDLDAAALYGTKHTVAQTRALILEKTAELGYELDAEDFAIEKDAKNSVYITLTYVDEIRFFGITLKEFEFTLEASAREIREAF